MSHLRTKTARFASENLKRCPLCGGVNAINNFECMVCTWSGAFDHDPVAIQEGLDELLAHCPELIELINEKPSAKRTWYGNFWKGLKSLFRKSPVDIWA